VLADHFERAGENPRAIHWLGVAAQQALDADDLVETLGRVERGVKLGAAGEELYAMRVTESEARYWRGEYSLAENAGREALATQNERLRLEAIGNLIRALGHQAKYGEVARWVQTMDVMDVRRELRGTWLGSRINAVSFLDYGGDTNALRSTLALVERFSNDLNPVLVGRVHSVRARIADYDGNHATSVEELRAACQHFEEIGQRRLACAALGNLAITLQELGLLEEAEASLRRVLETAERLGLKYFLGGALLNLALVLTFDARPNEARPLLARAIAITQKQGEIRSLGTAECYAALTELLAGVPAQGEEWARRATETLKPVPSFRPAAIAVRARCVLAQGRAGEALEYATTASQLLEAAGSVDDGEAWIRLALVECLHATGDDPGARAALSLALARIQEQAEKIPISAWRHAFWHRIPDHARILELGRQWGLLKTDPG
jgi:tetratricopeptide (TPR) repeat protein